MIAVGASRCKQKCLLLLTDFKTLQETKKCALMATVGETRDLTILRVEEITTRTDTCLVMYVSNPRVPVPPLPPLPGQTQGRYVQNVEVGKLRPSCFILVPPETGMIKRLTVSCSLIEKSKWSLNRVKCASKSVKRL